MVSDVPPVGITQNAFFELSHCSSEGAIYRVLLVFSEVCKRVCLCLTWKYLPQTVRQFQISFKIMHNKAYVVCGYKRIVLCIFLNVSKILLQFS
jgi:hypothetical protein